MLRYAGAMPRRSIIASAFSALLPWLMAVPALAQGYDENPFGHDYYVLGDVRAVAAGGERGWLDGGFGKGRFGGDEDGLRPAEAALVLQPHLGWAVDATVAVTAQRGQTHAVDLSEAFVTWRAAPTGPVRASARIGLFWPQVSLEHGGPAWSVTETITPSAINAWIGEEVKLVAAEASATVPLAGGRLSATAAVFGFNDTSGTLLSFRGWALHDVKATAFGSLPLPPLNAFMQTRQSRQSRSVIELDDRPGFYGKLGWTGGPLTLQGFYYDNRGNPQVDNDRGQWGWRTRFAHVGARLKLADGLQFTAQAMSGSTRMGFNRRGVIWVDTRFRSAYLLATQTIGAAMSVSARVEAFDTKGRGSIEGPESSERGHAGTLAARRNLGPHVTLLAELLRISSRRPDRSLAGLPPYRRQTTGQMSARVAF